MGDRANVVLMLEQQWISPDNVVKVPLFIYSHWGGVGSQIAGIAAGLRNSRERWGDDSYFTRIFVQSALEAMGAQPERATGFGLGLCPSDNEHPYAVVDQHLQVVWVQADVPTSMSTWQSDAIVTAGGRPLAMTFDEFIAFASGCSDLDEWYDLMAQAVDSKAREGASS